MMSVEVYHAEIGYNQAIDDLCSLLGLSNHHSKEFIFSYIQEIEKQAMAWQSMNHIIDKTVEPMIAANRLVKEIEQYRESLQKPVLRG